MPLPATVRPAVSPSIISRVNRLFNGSIDDVLAELLQNARRAGASRVGVSAVDLDDRRVLAVVDNGRGIDEPGALLSLGDSGWDGATALREDPAGMGFFSLAGHRVEVRSRSQTHAAGWRMVIEPGAWHSARPIAVSPHDLAGGTEVLIDLPQDWDERLERAVRHAARHYPLPVLVQGVECERADWLADAVHVEVWSGSRIGVIEGSARRNCEGSINFHGVTVPLRLPSVSEVEHGRTWHVRVDIGDTPDLQLVLPARKEVVQTPFVEKLTAACEAAIFRVVAASGPHRLGYADYCRARALGVALGEAAAKLHAWRPSTADYAVERGPLVESAMIRMGGIEPKLDQTAARALALAPDADLPLVIEQSGFEGYGWYDVLDRVSDVRLRIVRGDTEHVIDDGNRVELASGAAQAIIVEFVIVAADGASRTIALPSDVALIATDDYASDLDSIGLLVALMPAITVPELVDLLMRAAFCPSDDHDSDSYDTQRDYFEREALQLARTHLIGADAAIVGRALDRAHDHIRWLVPDGRTLLMAITRDDAQAAFRGAPLPHVEEAAFLAEIEQLTRTGDPQASSSRLVDIRAACVARRQALLARTAFEQEISIDGG